MPQIIDDLVLPKAIGKGIRLDKDNPDYAWRDIIGYIMPDSDSPIISPALAVFQTGIKAYEFDANDLVHCTYHVPHDYAPGTDMLIHMHWGHNGTDISGTFTVEATSMYASRVDTPGPAAVFSTPVTGTISIGSLNITAYPQYCHSVAEIGLSTSGGSATELDTADIEVDGLIIVSFQMIAVPTITGGSGKPFIFTSDIHYQSTNIGTKNNAPDFYA